MYRMLCENSGSGNHGRDLICVRSDPALEFEFILVRRHIIIHSLTIFEVRTFNSKIHRYQLTHWRINASRTVRTGNSLEAR